MKRGLPIVALLLAALGAHAQDDVQRLFPKARGQDLNGRDVSLPGDFPGPASLVFVAFEMRQQEDVDSWHAFVQALKSDNPSLAAWELPTMARSYLLMRFIIDNGMRSVGTSHSQPDPVSAWSESPCPPSEVATRFSIKRNEDGKRPSRKQPAASQAIP